MGRRFIFTPGLENKVKNSNPIRVLVTGKHLLSREGLCRLLDDEPDIAASGDVADGSSLATNLQNGTPDVILLDSALPGSSAHEHVQTIRGASPGARIVLLEDSDAPLNGARAAGDAPMLVGGADGRAPAFHFIHIPKCAGETVNRALDSTDASRARAFQCITLFSLTTYASCALVDHTRFRS